MRDWENTPWVKLYTPDNPDWVAMPWEARAVLLFLLKGRVDRAGFVDLGRQGLDALPSILALPAEVAGPGIRYLLDVDHCIQLREVDGRAWLYWPNYVIAQAAKSSDNQRKAAQREREKAEALATAMGLHVTPGGHAQTSRSKVTPGGHDQIRSDQIKDSLAAQAAEPKAGQAGSKAKAPRKKSRARLAYEWAATQREKVTSELDKKLSDEVLNTKLGALLDRFGLERVQSWYLAFLADKGYPARSIPPWPFLLFLSQWDKYRRAAEEKKEQSQAAATTGFRVVGPGEDPYA